MMNETDGLLSVAEVRKLWLEQYVRNELTEDLNLSMR